MSALWTGMSFHPRRRAGRAGLFVVEARLQFFRGLAGLRVYPVGDADFRLGFLQRLAFSIAGILPFLHVLHCFEQRREGAKQFVAKFVLPVKAVRPLDYARPVIVW